MSKQPPLPDSFIIEQLVEFLDCVEQTAQESVSKLDKFIDEDKDFGYCKAAGYAQSRLEWMASRAASFRKIYLTN